MVGHVGDSRAYHATRERLLQLTADHSVVADLVRSGGLRESEAQFHPYRNLLTRAIGTAPHVEADVTSVDLGPGEALLLCTDGLTAVLDDAEIHRTLMEERDPQACALRLVEMANGRGARQHHRGRRCHGGEVTLRLLFLAIALGDVALLLAQGGRGRDAAPGTRRSFPPSTPGPIWPSSFSSAGKCPTGFLTLSCFPPSWP